MDFDQLLFHCKLSSGPALLTQTTSPINLRPLARRLSNSVARLHFNQDPDLRQCIFTTSNLNFVII